MELITGHHGDTVITAEQFAEYNRMLVGDDSAIVYRSRTSNFCATSTSGLYWTMDTGHLLANGRDIAVDEAETVGTDPTTTYNRIDSIFLEVLRDDTTLVERAEFVLELGTEAEEPTAPDTPTDADDTLTTLLSAIRVADLVVDGDEITSYTDYTEELPGFATYVTQAEHDADKAEVEAAYQAADSIIKKEVPWYATSDSAESTIAKIATCNQTGFALTTGAKVIVKFDYTNTASSPTLNVNDTGDIAIVAYGTTAPELYWVAGDVVEFTYDGTSWVMHPTQGQVDTLNSNLTYKTFVSLSTNTSFDLSSIRFNELVVNITESASSATTPIHLIKGISGDFRAGNGTSANQPQWGKCDYDGNNTISGVYYYKNGSTTSTCYTSIYYR